MYLLTKDVAEKWGIDQSRVLRLAREGRIEGAVLLGKNWVFPYDVKKPDDLRKKSAESSADNTLHFRFPSFVSYDEVHSHSLSNEEKRLKQAQVDFQTLNIEDAKNKLIPLSQNSSNRYIRISALYYLCYTAMFDESLNFDSYYLKLKSALIPDFPYKKEMQLFLYKLESEFGCYKSVFEDFNNDPDYFYHPSSYSALTICTLFITANKDMSIITKFRFDIYEIQCQQMEHEGQYYEAQQLHFLLMAIYHLQNDINKMNFHIYKGLEIAANHKLYVPCLLNTFYYANIINNVLDKFPDEFKEKIYDLEKSYQKNMALMTDLNRNNSYLNILSNAEFEYAFLTSQGYSNREIAEQKKISEKVVSNIYNKIYDKLGIQSKKDLMKLINDTYN